MYCSNCTLYPLCIEVNNSTLAKAMGSQALTLYKRAVEAEQPLSLGADRRRHSCSKPMGPEGPLTLMAALQLQQLLPCI